MPGRSRLIEISGVTTLFDNKTKTYTVVAQFIGRRDL